MWNRPNKKEIEFANDEVWEDHHTDWFLYKIDRKRNVELIEDVEVAKCNCEMQFKDPFLKSVSWVLVEWH